MTESHLKRVPLYRARAEEAARQMEILLKEEEYSGAVDRAYYAVFHMAQAILAAQGLEFSSHEAVIAAFGREFAKSGKLDPRYHRILIDTFDSRLTADYDVESVVSEEAAKGIADECRSFLKGVSEKINVV